MNSLWYPRWDRLQSCDGGTFLLQSDILLHFSTSYESKSQILGGITQG